MSGASNIPKKQEFLQEISELKTPGKLTWIRSGTNAAVGATQTDLWSPGGIQIKPSVPGVVTLVSTDAGDAPAGIGTRSVAVYGLDATYTYQKEIVAMNGLTPVVTSAAFFRVSRLETADVGSNLFNTGDISATVGGNIQDLMLAGQNFSHNFNYTVPAKYWLMVTDFTIMAESGRDVQLDTYVRNPFVNSGIWRNQTSYIIPSPAINKQPSPFFFFAPYTDLSVRLTKLAGAAGAASGLGIGYLTSDPNINSGGNDIEEVF